MGYIVLPIDRDASDAEAASFEVIRNQWPTWQADDADVMTQMIRACAVLYGDVAELATRMGEEAFRYYGRGLASIKPLDDRPATGRVTFVAVDSAGPYRIEEGTEVTGRGLDGDRVAFRTVADAIIPMGQTTVTVAVEASQDGAYANQISGAAEPNEYLDFVASAAFVEPTGNGQDAEPDADYLTKLNRELQLSSPKVINSADIAKLAVGIAGTYRATVLPHYKPGPPWAIGPEATAQSFAATVVPVAFDGESIGPANLDVLRAFFAGQVGDLQNGAIYVMDPTYTGVLCEVNGIAQPGEDPDVVAAAVLALTTGYLSPAQYGLRRDTGEDPEWINQRIIYRYGIAQHVGAIETLQTVTSVRLALHGDDLDDQDVELPGRAPLPRPESVVANIVAG